MLLIIDNTLNPNISFLILKYVHHDSQKKKEEEEEEEEEGEGEEEEEGEEEVSAPK